MLLFRSLAKKAKADCKKWKNLNTYVDIDAITKGGANMYNAI